MNMETSLDSKSIERLRKRIIKLYDSQNKTRDINEVLDIFEHDPDLFNSCLKRAKSYTYKDKGYIKNTLWIACNIVESLKEAPFCYFCGRSINRDDFIKGEVHIEHFIPRSEGGPHHPINITLSCKQCNSLKSALTDDDFMKVLNDPSNFFSNSRWSDKRKEQLIDFAEIFYPRIAGLQGYKERHKTCGQNIKKHWEKRRRKYRDKWRSN